MKRLEPAAKGRLAGLEFAEGVVVQVTTQNDPRHALRIALSVIREEQGRVRRGES